MPTSALGSRRWRTSGKARPGAAARVRPPDPTRHPARRRSTGRRPHGFTLIEVMVVLLLVALASTATVLALRDAGDGQLEREGQRLAALFEAARAQSRTSGAPIHWRSEGGQFLFAGPGLASALPARWLGPEAVLADGAPTVKLGPEPVIGPQQVVLRLASRPERSLRITTDGLRPFEVQ